MITAEAGTSLKQPFLNTGGQRRETFPALTGVRFPLAIWVVSYHLAAGGEMWESLAGVPVLNTILSHAYTALGTFFAISGFVLARGYSDTRWTSSNSKRYVIARFARIYPLYIFSLLIIAPIVSAHLQSPALGAITERAGILLNYLLLLQGWDRPPVDWNTPAWSLSCEVVFYASFPFIAALLRGRRRRTALLTGLTFGIPVAVLLLPFPNGWKPLIYFGDFLAGVCASELYDVILTKWPRLSGKGYVFYIPAIVGGSALVLCAELIQPWILFDQAMRLANGALVLGLAIAGGMLCRVLSTPLAEAGGSASYAIYILHVPVLWWYKRSAAYEYLPDFAAGVLYLAVVVVLAMVVSRYFEGPANAFVRRTLLTRYLQPELRGRSVSRATNAPRLESVTGL